MTKTTPWMAVFFMMLTAICHAETTSPTISVSNDSLMPALNKMKAKIVFESHRNGSFEIMVMNADGTNQKNLTNTPQYDETYPQCSPDGKLIAFECCDNTSGAQYRIELMNADGTGRRNAFR